jgi:acetylornithine deacetylase/succinyl-diaminopimelate desuccinylase family protein
MSQDLLSKLDAGYTLRLLKDMVAIDSVVGHEADLAAYLHGELDSLGLDCELHDVAPGRPNVYARLAGRAPGRQLHFNGHTDTVAVCEGWDTDPFTPVIKDGRLYGLGACDMKAGIACILTMLRAFVESARPFPGELSFSGVIDEEAHSLGAKALLKTGLAGCDAVVLAEPYPGDESKPIPLGITGKVLYDILVKGRAAHGFHPELGVNAVEDAARILEALVRLPMQRHPQFGTGNTCTLKIEGGYHLYAVVVPDRCRVEINRLLVPGETTSTALDDMRALVRSLDLRSEVDVSLKPPRYEPFVMSADEPILCIFDGVYREVMGVAPAYEYTLGITDANVFAGEGGLPCLHLGPARGGAHQPNEYVPLEWLEPVSRMYALIAARFLEGG